MESHLQIHQFLRGRITAISASNARVVIKYPRPLYRGLMYSGELKLNKATIRTGAAVNILDSSFFWAIMTVISCCTSSFSLRIKDVLRMT